MAQKKNGEGESLVDSAADRSRFGFLNGQIEVPDDFDRMGASEIEELFGGEAGADGGDSKESR